MENTNAPVVSVVIPMYNVEKYIGECLDSLLNQTLQDFEVIVVDDCSTDNSCAVVESYVKKFGGRLKIYTNQQNSGAAASRNNGLLVSRGEYVYFMDSDDMLLLTGLEKMYTTAKKYDADVVNLLGFYKMSSNAKAILAIYKNPRVFKNGAQEVFVDDDLAWRFEKSLAYRFYSGPWLRFFRRDFLTEKRLFFPDHLKSLEDIIWKHGFFILAKRIVHVPFRINFYRMSKKSLTRQKKTPAQYMNYRMTTVIEGIKWIGDVMSRSDFFEQNPHYRYKVLEDFMADIFGRLLGHTLENERDAFYVYDLIKREFSKKLGSYAVPVAELCSLIDDQNKEIAKLQERLKG